MDNQKHILRITKSGMQKLEAIKEKYPYAIELTLFFLVVIFAGFLIVNHILNPYSFLPSAPDPILVR